eukprot:3072572-Rhodomonas_salina.3
MLLPARRCGRAVDQHAHLLRNSRLEAVRVVLVDLNVDVLELDSEDDSCGARVEGHNVERPRDGTLLHVAHNIVHVVEVDCRTRLHQVWDLIQHRYQNPVFSPFGLAVRVPDHNVNVEGVWPGAVDRFGHARSDPVSWLPAAIRRLCKRAEEAGNFTVDANPRHIWRRIGSDGCSLLAAVGPEAELILAVVPEGDVHLHALEACRGCPEVEAGEAAVGPVRTRPLAAAQRAILNVDLFQLRVGVPWRAEMVWWVRPGTWERVKVWEARRPVKRTRGQFWSQCKLRRSSASVSWWKRRASSSSSHRGTTCSEMLAKSNWPGPRSASRLMRTRSPVGMRRMRRSVSALPSTLICRPFGFEAWSYSNTYSPSSSSVGERLMRSRGSTTVSSWWMSRMLWRPCSCSSAAMRRTVPASPGHMLAPASVLKYGVPYCRSKLTSTSKESPTSGSLSVNMTALLCAVSSVISVVLCVSTTQHWTVVSVLYRKAWPPPEKKMRLSPMFSSQKLSSCIVMHGSTSPAAKAVIAPESQAT